MCYVIEVTLFVCFVLQTVSSISNDEGEIIDMITTPSQLQGNTTSEGQSNSSDTSADVQAVTCSQQCSEQDLSYCTGYSNPIEDDLKLSISCNTRNLAGRDRHVTNYIGKAIDGHWQDTTVIFQQLLKTLSPESEMFPDLYFAPETALLSVLEGHKMSNTCSSDYYPLKQMLCSWMYVSPCHDHFKICEESCTSLMEECFSTAMGDYSTRNVLKFVCGVLSRNNSNCFLPEDVYREDYESRRDSDKDGADYITILSASAGVVVFLGTVVFLLAAVRYYLRSQGDDVMKFEMLDPVCDRARKLLGKSDLFPHLRTNPSLAERHLALKKRSAPRQNMPWAAATRSDISLDQLDAYSMNSSASTFYCQTDNSVSTLGDVLPPENVYFEGVLSSRWKSSEDEVIALVSWIDGIGNKKKGVIKCYTDKRRKQMEDELNLISVLSHDNVCEYVWRSMGNRPHVRGMSPHLQSVMSVRNNYFCTEYYTLGSLKDFLISRGHFLKDTVAQSFFRDITSGMSYLHDMEVFHRDLKTANILVGSRLTKSGGCPFRLVVSDFGHSQEKHRQDCFVRDGSGGTSQYTAPEVLLSTGSDKINLYKADVYSMALVSWELLSYACCKSNEHQLNRHQVQVDSSRCQIQNHTAFGAYLLNRFPDLSSTSTSSSVVREYMRNMYKSNLCFRPPIPERWCTVSSIITSLITVTRKMWISSPVERISTAQLARMFSLPRYNSRISLQSNKKTVKNTLSSVLCMNPAPT